MSLMYFIIHHSSFLSGEKVAAAVEITSGTLNGLMKLTGFKDRYPDLYASVSGYLFFLECLTLTGELSLGLRKALLNSARKNVRL